MNKEKFYITTSVAYTNAPPHIGFALELIQADVLARLKRLEGKKVYFLTGTDEHGLKIQKSAEKKGLPPEKFSSQIAKKFRELARALNISNDDFIRTSDTKRHRQAVYKIWRKFKDKGDIYKKAYEGYYCLGCEAFIPKKDLVDGKCPIHKAEPQFIKEDNYFFRLSKYQNQIKEAIKNNQVKIVPKERKNEILKFICGGLEDISFSRSIKNLHWGFQVPDDKSQIIYVWADALSNYISALGYASDSKVFYEFWPADIHCIGKDILRFHSVYWLAMLLSLEIPLPKTILVHGFITSEGQKMSKSLGNVVDPFELVRKYGTEAVRYFLLREIPSTKDGDFTYEKFEERYNSDLAKGLGNLLSRTLTLAKKMDVKTPTVSQAITVFIADPKLKYKKALQNFKFNEALIAIWEIIGILDRYIEKEKPWEQKDNAKKVIADCLFALKEIAKLIEPFLPETSEKMFKQLKTLTPQPLFPRL